MTTPTRPLLRYHGGKWELAPWIIQHFPDHRTYTEVFGGGASVLLRKSRSYAEVYNDLDGEVVNLFRVVRDNGADLLEKLHLTPYAREEFDLSYVATEDALEKARRTVVRSYMGFGGDLGRPTAAGPLSRTGFRITSPTSGANCARVWANYPEALEAIIARMRGVLIENRDGAEVLARNDYPDTLHYVDPPYVMSTRGPGDDYRHEMDDAAHRKLAAVLDGLEGAVVLSGYPSALYNELYGHWLRVERSAQADGARERTEVLWLKNCPQAAFSFL